MLLSSLLSALRHGCRAAKRAGLPKETRRPLKQIHRTLRELTGESQSFRRAVLSFLGGEEPNGFGYHLIGLAACSNAFGGGWGGSAPGKVAGTFLGDTPADVLEKIAQVFRADEACGGDTSSAQSFYTGLAKMPRGDLLRFVEMVLDAADDATALTDPTRPGASTPDAFTAWARERLHTAALIATGRAVSDSARAALYRETKPPPQRSTWQDKAAILCSASPLVRVEWFSATRLWAITGLTFVNGNTRTSDMVHTALDRLIEETFTLATTAPDGSFFEVPVRDDVTHRVRLNLRSPGPRWEQVS